jgi:Fe-S cluster assembly iron-binding protein IscA
MEVKITETAKAKLADIMKDSDLKSPALRIVFHGFG